MGRKMQRGMATQERLRQPGQRCLCIVGGKKGHVGYLVKVEQVRLDEDGQQERGLMDGSLSYWRERAAASKTKSGILEHLSRGRLRWV